MNFGCRDLDTDVLLMVNKTILRESGIHGSLGSQGINPRLGSQRMNPRREPGIPGMDGMIPNPDSGIPGGTALFYEASIRYRNNPVPSKNDL